MTDKELITRLNNLFWLLEEEGHYTKANTARFAADRIEAQAAEIERLRAALAKAVEERDEAIRRRDAWKAKAEGYDAVRKALREKVGAPWPPNLSRALWAGLAADEKKRADDAEGKLAKAVAMLDKTRLVLAEWEPHPFPVLAQVRTTLAEIKGESHE